MFPQKHLFFGTIFSLVLFFLFPSIGWLGFLTIFASTVLIDVDHYIWYVFKKKDLNLKNSYKWFVNYHKKILVLPRKQRNKVTNGCICFLHGIEVLLILFLLGFLYKFFFYVFAGFVFHLVLDVIYQYSYIDRIEKVSIVWDILRGKGLRVLE